MEGIRIFQVNDAPEWYAGENADAVAAHCAEQMSQSIESLKEDGVLFADGPRVLTDEEIDSLKVEDEGGPEDEPPLVQTFRQSLAEMIADGTEFPCFFASTER